MNSSPPCRQSARKRCGWLEPRSSLCHERAEKRNCPHRPPPSPRRQAGGGQPARSGHDQSPAQAAPHRGRCSAHDARATQTRHAADARGLRSSHAEFAAQTGCNPRGSSGGHSGRNPETARRRSARGPGCATTGRTRRRSSRADARSPGSPRSRRGCSSSPHPRSTRSRRPIGGRPRADAGNSHSACRSRGPQAAHARSTRSGNARRSCRRGGR